MEVIGNPRIIFGIFSEVVESKIQLEFISDDTKVICNLEFDFFENFKDCVLKVRDEKILSEGFFLVSFNLNSKRIQFQVNVNKSKFILPSSLTVIENRDETRLKIKNDELIEVRTENRTYIGKLIDLSQTHCCIQLTQEHGVRISEDVLINSIVSTKVSSFNLNGNIDEVRDDNTILISFDTKRKEDREYDRKTNLRLIIDFEYKLDDKIYEGEIYLNDYSIKGFSGEISFNGPKSLLIEGIKLRSKKYNVEFSNVWGKDNFGGFEILSYKDNNYNWFKLVKKYYSEINLINSLNASDLASLFTQASFVIKERRSIYGKDISRFVPIKVSSDSPRVLLRFATSENEELNAHVSTFRISDNAWLLQEGAFLQSTSFDIYEFYEEVLKELKIIRKLDDSFPSVMFGICNKKIKKHTEYWVNFARNEKQGTVLNSYHFKKKENNKNNTNIKFYDLNYFSLEERVERFKTFDSMLFAFDLLSYKRPNKWINDKLKKYGDKYGIHIYLAEENNKFLDTFIVVPSVSYNFNMTGFLNTAFVFSVLENREKVEDIIKNIREIAWGINDIQLITASNFDFKDVVNEFVFFGVGLGE